MAKRLNNQTTTLKSWDDVNTTLHRIAEINARVSNAKAKADLKRLEIERALDDATKVEIEEKLQLEGNIELFCKDHRDEFDESRTKRFVFGLVKLRWLPPKLVTRGKRTWATVLEELKRRKMGDFIRVKEEPDKDALKGLKEEQLREVGCDLVQDEEFFYEAFETELEGAK